MIAYNTTAAKQVLIKLLVACGIIGYLFCPVTLSAQEKQDYWLLTTKRNKYKIEPQNKIDTITLLPNALKQTICIAQKTANSDVNSKKIIVLMTNTRQEVARFILKNGEVCFHTAMISTVTDKIVSINLIQQPSGLLSKRARVGTKLLCYLQW